MKKVEESALGVKVVKGVRPDQQLVKVVNDELVSLMGGEKQDLNEPRLGPQVRVTSSSSWKEMAVEECLSLLGTCTSFACPTRSRRC